jgi:hypothetical protein
VLCVTVVPVTSPAESSATLTNAVPVVAEARVSGAMSGGGGAATTDATALGCEQPALGIALGAAAGCAGAGVGAGVPLPPPGPGALPIGSALPRGRGTGRLGGGVVGGGGGTFATAMVVDRRSIETTSALFSVEKEGGCRSTATMTCSSSESANATSSKRGMRFTAHRGRIYEFGWKSARKR